MENLAVQEANIAAVLDEVPVAEPKQEIHKVVVVVPEEEKPLFQLWEAVVAGPDPVVSWWRE